MKYCANVLSPVCMCAQSLQSCLTLCNPMDYSLSGSSVHGIFLARILECYLLQNIKHVSTRMLSATSCKICNSSLKNKVNLLIHRTVMSHDKFSIRKSLTQKLHDVLKDPVSFCFCFATHGISFIPSLPL